MIRNTLIPFLFLYCTQSVSATISLFDSFSNTNSGNGINYLAVGDARPINTSNSSSSYQLLNFTGDLALGGGSNTFNGPTYTAPNRFYPYVQQEKNRGFLALHPEGVTEGASNGAFGAGIEVVIQESGTYRVTGIFARANDFVLAGDGVDVGIYLNRQLSNPLFESNVSSNFSVDINNVFGGLGVANFDFLVNASVGDSLLFSVFSGSQGLSGSFDVTALQGNLTTVPTPAAVWLFGSGLIGLIGMRHKKNQQNY